MLTPRSNKEEACMYTLSFKSVSIDFADTLRAWRNDPATRHASLRTQPVTQEEHTKWLLNTLHDTPKGRILKIALYHDTPVGVIRSDYDPADGYHELSYTVAPESRGKGFGSTLVTQFVSSYLVGAKIKATILDEGNTASEAVARACGMHPEENVLLGEPPRTFRIWRNDTNRPQ